MTFSVIETGGKQYIVSSGTKLKVEKLTTKNGEEFSIDKVLLRVDGEDVQIGTPYLSTAVKAKVLGQGREKKKLVFRYHSKTRYRKKKGHRQPFTEVEILSV